MRKIIFSFLTFVSLTAAATHNRSGYISYTCDNNGKYTFYIHTWTNASALASDRCDLTLWIDNIDSVHCTRVNGSNPCPNGPIGFDGVVILAPQGGFTGIRENIYQSDSSYVLMPGMHAFTMIDPNRQAGIINLGGSSSQNVAFALADSVLLSNSFPGQMTNNSPVVGFAPINAVLAGQPFSYNPAMFDSDNDSLEFSLGAPFDNDLANPPAGVQVCPTWYKPSGIAIDPVTGMVHTNSAPTTQGEYIITIRVREFRRNPSTGNCNTWYVVGTTFYDVQLTVVAGTSNFNINFTAPTQICMQAGSTSSTQVVAAGTASATPVIMEAAGLPLTGTNIGTNALFSSVASSLPVNGTFAWNPSCLSVSKLSYPVYFRLSDNSYPPLADFRTVFVRVVSAPPSNLVVTNSGNTAMLTWNAPLNCDSHLVNYYIYRKDTCDSYIPSSCQTGAPVGYTHVGTTASSVTTFNDIGLSPGNHTYLVVAEFVDCSESVASSSACTVVGVAENASMDKIALFPNPSTGNIKVISAVGEADFILTNAIGEVVYKTHLQKKEIDLSMLPKGIYFATISVNGTKTVRKVILE